MCQGWANSYGIGLRFNVLSSLGSVSGERKEKKKNGPDTSAFTFTRIRSIFSQIKDKKKRNS